MDDDDGLLRNQKGLAIRFKDGRLHRQVGLRQEGSCSDQDGLAAGQKQSADSPSFESNLTMVPPDCEAVLPDDSPTRSRSDPSLTRIAIILSRI